jgi:DNA-binding transcriptional MerR regulator
MKELGPAEFSAATALSVKALRLYDERGLLVPARVDRATGSRRYAKDQMSPRSVSRFCAGPA